MHIFASSCLCYSWVMFLLVDNRFASVQLGVRVVIISEWQISETGGESPGQSQQRHGDADLG